MKILKLALALSALPLLAATSHAQTFQLFMTGPNESPANASPGLGGGTVIFNTVAHTMSINVTFSGLTGNTTAAHIHAATTLPGLSTAGVATQTPSFTGFPLGVTSGTFTNTFDMTLTSSFSAAYITANGGTPATAEAALVAAATSGRAYFNIHTSTFGGGEIRGFLIATAPEPGTIALGLLGLGVLGYRRKRA
jgi:CHRD domain/PEP-CTERM motif